MFISHLSTRGSYTVKHCIKVNPPFDSISVTSSNLPSTQIVLHISEERVILYSLGVFGCKDSQRVTDLFSHWEFSVNSLWICTTERDLQKNRIKSSGIQGFVAFHNKVSASWHPVKQEVCFCLKMLNNQKVLGIKKPLKGHQTTGKT